MATRGYTRSTGGPLPLPQPRARALCATRSARMRRWHCCGRATGGQLARRARPVALTARGGLCRFELASLRSNCEHLQEPRHRLLGLHSGRSGLPGSAETSSMQALASRGVLVQHRATSDASSCRHTCRIDRATLRHRTAARLRSSSSSGAPPGTWGTPVAGQKVRPYVARARRAMTLNSAETTATEGVPMNTLHGHVSTSATPTTADSVRRASALALMPCTLLRREVTKGGDLGVHNKGSTVTLDGRTVIDAQTEADRRVEKALLASLAAAFPEVSVVGEESSEGALDSVIPAKEGVPVSQLQSTAALEAMSSACEWYASSSQLAPMLSAWLRMNPDAGSGSLIAYRRFDSM
eukprot:scaffold593_cov382-Prasinococcus_capsulatus_cf.AAC.1